MTQFRIRMPDGTIVEHTTTPRVLSSSNGLRMPGYPSKRATKLQGGKRRWTAKESRGAGSNNIVNAVHETSKTLTISTEAFEALPKHPSTKTLWFYEDTPTRRNPK